MSLLIFIAEPNYMHPRGGANVGTFANGEWNEIIYRPILRCHSREGGNLRTCFYIVIPAAGNVILSEVH